MKEHKGVAPGVIVTGASRGLGRGIALELASRGYSVIINYRSNTNAAEKTALECETLATARYERTNTIPSVMSAARQVFPVVQADISSPEDRKKLVHSAFGLVPEIRSLINNAGIAPTERRDIVDASPEVFTQVLETNLQGPYFLTQEVVRSWLERSTKPVDQKADQSARRIIFITSISAETVSLNRGEYCIAKAGLSMAARLWATRLAAENILVTEIRPGIMRTDMTDSVAEKYDQLIEEGLVPQRRWGSPEDVAKICRVIADGDLPYSTGSVIHCDGGIHLSRL